MNAWYDVFFTTSTFATPAAAKRYMKKKLGYSNVKKHNDIKHDQLISMVDNRRPVFVAAHNRWGYGNAHAWVIDGYMKQTRTKTIRNGSSILSTSTENRTLVHCNFGWWGRANGYYEFKVFDTTNGPVAFDEDNPYSEGHEFSMKDWHVETHYRMITYTK